MKCKLLSLGLGGSVIVALCCVTPLLPWLLGALGLSAFIGYVHTDAVLLPALAGFRAMTGYALWRRRIRK